MEMHGLEHHDIRLHGTLDRQAKKAKDIQAKQKTEELPVNIDVDFDRLIETKEELENMPKMSKGEVKRIVEALHSIGKRQEAVETIIRKVCNETSHLEDYEELQLVEALLTGQPLTEVQDIPIEWGAKNKLSKGKRAVFRAKNRTILIGPEHPEIGSVLSALLSEGHLGSEISSAAHELTHGHQYPKKVPNKQLRILHRRGVSLREAHAYRTQQLHRKTSKTEIIKDRIFQARDGKKKLYKGVSIPKLIYAVHAIDQLIALNFSPQEIGYIIQHSGAWDKAQQVYTGVQTFIEDQMATLGIDEFDLENLVQAHHLEREIERLRAIQIAQSTVDSLMEQYSELGLFNEPLDEKKRVSETSQPKAA